MAFHHEFVVNYVVLYVWGVLLVLLLFLLLLAAFLFLLLVLTEISDLLYADDLGQLGANFLADLLGLLEPVLHSNFLAIELLNKGEGYLFRFPFEGVDFADSNFEDIIDKLAEPIGFLDPEVDLVGNYKSWIGGVVPAKISLFLRISY